MDTKISSVGSSLRAGSFSSMNESQRLQRLHEMLAQMPEDISSQISVNIKKQETSSLNFSRDADLGTMVLRVSNPDGSTKFQIPEEVRLRLAKAQLEQKYFPYPKPPTVLDIDV